MIRGLAPAFLLLPALVLTGCGSVPARSSADAGRDPSEAFALQDEDAPRRGVPSPDPCAPTRVHRDSDYTPGGLYAPDVADSGPAVAIDVSRLPEPVPRAELRSRYGNRSPYTVLGKSYRVLESAEGYRERGVASWYGAKFNGRATSSGELYDICQFTAAHKTLPLPSYVRVTNLDNGRRLVVRVNDRGPFHAGRVMDLSYAAAVRLGVDRTGTARVEIEAVGPGDAAGEPLRAVEPPLDRSLDAAVVATPVSAPMTPATPAVTPVAAFDGRRIVQVGSFGEKDNARRLADRLRAADVDDVDVDHVDVDGRDLWRVRVGPMDFDDAEALLARLRAMGLPGARVFSE
jgi:rare lipoprotein A